MNNKTIIYEQNNYSTILIGFLIFNFILNLLLYLLGFWGLSIFISLPIILVLTALVAVYFSKKLNYFRLDSDGVVMYSPITKKSEHINSEDVFVVNKGDRYAYNSSGSFMFHIKVKLKGRKEKTIGACSLNDKQSRRFITKLNENNISLKNRPVYD